MPKDPIRSRTWLYDRLRGGTIIFLDWHLVNTSLGVMVEAASLVRTGFSTNDDPYDSDATDMMPFSRDALFTTLNTGGDLYPRTYNTQ